MLSSSSIKSRVADLHAAFADDSVDAILATIGGFNSNELLPYIDYDLIAKHPKIICGIRIRQPFWMLFLLKLETSLTWDRHILV